MSKTLEHIDELYRQRFENFEAEPPQEVWGRVKDKLHPPGGGASGNLGRSFLLSIISMMSLIAIVFFLINPFNNSKPSLASGDYIAYLDQEQQNDNTIAAVTPAEVQDDASDAESSEKILLPAEITVNTNEAIKEETAPEHQQEALGTLENKSRIEWQFVNPEFDYLNARKESRFMPGNDSYYDPVRTKGFWQFGLSANPEIVLYPNDSINNSRNYNFDLSVSYHKSGFFLETGLGISIARDEGRYFVDYESYDHIGSYNDLVGITYDSTETGVVPVYHSEEVDIYDSIRHLRIEKSTNTYTYLQLPLLIGYEKKFKRFGYYVKGGPNFSLLINKNIPGAKLPEDVRVFDVDARLAERIKTNWQLLFGAGITYRLSNNMDLAVEPTFRYYLNSAYDRQYVSSKHPFAFGIRAGIKFRIK